MRTRAKEPPRRDCVMGLDAGAFTRPCRCCGRLKNINRFKRLGKRRSQVCDECRASQETPQ